MSNYYRDRLPLAMRNAWNGRAANDSLRDARIENDGSRYWGVYDRDGQVITNWECRPFPGNNALVVTTQIELRANLRGRGLGKFFHELRRVAYKAAGFKGEICTVRSDSEAQTAIVAGSGTCMATLPSEFGGTFNVWMLPLNQTARTSYNTQPMPPRTIEVPAPTVDECGERQPYTHDTFCTKPLGHREHHSWVPEPLAIRTPPVTAPLSYRATPPVRTVIQSQVHEGDYTATVLAPPVTPYKPKPKKFAHRKASDVPTR